jgi:hypothetical protein
MVPSTAAIIQIEPDVEVADWAAQMEEQLYRLSPRRQATCCSYGFSNGILPYGMLYNGRRMPKLRARVNRWVDERIAQGADCFLCPMEQGADLMVAERVIAKRSVLLKRIRLIACLADAQMGEGMYPLVRDTFASLCERADGIVVANACGKGRGVRNAINQTLLERSGHMLAVSRREELTAVAQKAQAMGVEVTGIAVDEL